MTMKTNGTHTVNRYFKASAFSFKQLFYYTAIFYNIIFSPMHLLPQMDCMLESICIGSVEL